MSKKPPGTSGILWLRLDARSRRTLQDKYPPKYPNSYYDHVTLVYGVPKDEVGNLIGQSSSVYAWAYAVNSRVEAVRVRTQGLPDTYGVPHITLSTQPGIEPFESVAMLKSVHDEVAIDPPIKLDGELEFVPI